MMEETMNLWKVFDKKGKWRR